MILMHTTERISQAMDDCNSPVKINTVPSKNG